MILVRHAMSRMPQTISSDMTAADAAGLMRSEDVGALPVIENGKVVGILTDRDIVIRVVADRQDPASMRVGEICTRSPVTVTPDTRLSDARDLMAQRRIRRLPVMKGDELVGVLSLGDVAWADASTRGVGEALQAVSESESTRATSEDVPRGTPARVQEARS